MFRHVTKYSFATILFLLLLATGCSRDDSERGVVQINEGGALPDSEQTGVESDLSEPSPQAVGPGAEAQSEPVVDGSPTPSEAVAIPSEAVPTPSEPVPTIVESWPQAPLVSQEVLAAGGELTTGDYQVAIPGLEESVLVEFESVAPEAIRSPRPSSVVLAAVEMRPAYTITTDMMELTLPIEREIPRTTVLQLLSYNRSMEGFFVVDENRASDDGTVTFRTDMFSQYLVIAQPVAGETSCEGGPFAIGERTPNRPESAVVGEVPLDARMTREAAFAVLADMRFYEDSDLIVFKNEERNHQPPQYQDEDFLVDPRLAEPLLQLARAVREQWIDPIGGGPALNLRITDAYDSMIEHSAASNHYRGRAVDLTLSPVPAASRPSRANYYGTLTRLASCAGFDFVHFENRHHLHVSSRETSVAYLQDTPTGVALVAVGLDGKNRVEFRSLLGRSLASFEGSRLGFDDRGNLIATGDAQGTTTSYSINLATQVASMAADPEQLEPAHTPLLVGPSLAIESEFGLLVVRRTIPPQHTEVGIVPPSLQPYALTSDSVRGRLPAVWVAVD